MELTPGTLSFLRSWLANRDGPRSVTVAIPDAQFWAGPVIPSEPRVNTVVVDRRKAACPAPYVGEKDLAYVFHVGVIGEEVVAVGNADLVETGRPFYDPVIWAMSP